jgi:hypothetical protein
MVEADAGREHALRTGPMLGAAGDGDEATDQAVAAVFPEPVAAATRRYVLGGRPGAGCRACGLRG